MSLGRMWNLLCRVLVDAEVAGADPVAVAVDERILQRQEPQHAVDVEDRLQRRLELVRRRLVERAHRPIRSLHAWARRGLDRVALALVRLDVRRGIPARRARRASRALSSALPPALPNPLFTMSLLNCSALT
jgi:hypothetical protein